MTGAALKLVRPGVGIPPGDTAWLAETIRRNRFMPTPPADRMFVGDGDYRAIGAEFLRHFVEIGGLEPDAQFLDVGCGTGRLAVPLTQYLDPERASYDGFDPVRWAIDWCAENITSRYEQFRFRHLDLRHAIYNPEGTRDGATLTLPFDDGGKTFVAMVSVVTHLPAAEVRRYVTEVGRVLAPGGRLMLTGFVMGLGMQPAARRDLRLKFQRAGDGPEWHADPGNPLGAVAFDDGFVERIAEEAGLVARRKALGSWCGRSAAHYQDIFVIEKPRGEG